jgi:DNA repair exonuclease SbcCD ATPase subunit
VNPDYNLTLPNEIQTIIEALKFATTGELPANSKTGGGFIHDPKLRNEKELLAQVKLSFRSTSGIRMVATRNLQVTVTKTKSSQKALEGSLLMLKDGEKHSISTRVAELSQVIPQYLGVSKAVLENVIFCHQEDSLWPMSEPAKLKTKFDEIFEAVKYSSAVANLRTITKDKKIELGQLEIIEKNAKEDKSRAEQSEKKQAELFDQIEALRLSFDKVDAECEEAQQKAREAYNNAAQYEKIVAQLAGKRITLQANKESVAALQDDLKHMAESDSELQGMLDQYEERVATYASQYDDSRRQYASRILAHLLATNKVKSANMWRRENSMNANWSSVKVSSRKLLSATEFADSTTISQTNRSLIFNTFSAKWRVTKTKPSSVSEKKHRVNFVRLRANSLPLILRSPTSSNRKNLREQQSHQTTSIFRVYNFP